MKQFIRYIDSIVFTLTGLLFSFIPVALIICGSFFSIGIALVFIAQLFVSIPGPMTLSELWYVPLGILACWMGFKWDDVIIEHYPTSIERKKVTEEKKKLSTKP